MDVIDFLEQTPERVRALIDGQTEDALSFKAAPDVFSLRENVLHLRDIDIDGYEGRVIRILGENEPFFGDIDGARLARERNYNVQPVMPALEDFVASRACSIERVRMIAPADLDRTAVLQGVGRLTLLQLLDLWAQHDREHLDEMSQCVQRNAGEGLTEILLSSLTSAVGNED